jgi:lipoic acid synthetase
MKILKKPEWLKVRLSGTEHFAATKKLIGEYGLNTVCRSALCPNLQECWSSGTATFLLLGDTCTRSCRFCAITTTTAQLPFPSIDEPRKIARAVTKMQLNHVVLTSVTRDDLPDGGSSAWAKTIKAVREENPNVTIECLIPDFEGISEDLDRVMRLKPDVLNHNVETVPDLYDSVRPQADYFRSLEVLRIAKQAYDLRTKSGLMVGMGETEQQVQKVLDDLVGIGCNHLTIGQYLQPSLRHFPVHSYITPEKFDNYRKYALNAGFTNVQSGPYVRSSYHAADSV